MFTLFSIENKRTNANCRLMILYSMLNVNIPIQTVAPLQDTLLCLELQDTTKYLWVDLQSSLAWKNHIDRVCKKANSTLGFLRRNLKAGTEDTKANANFCMVRRNLDCWCSVWHPHHKDQKVEMVQRRAAPSRKHSYIILTPLNPTFI